VDGKASLGYNRDGVTVDKAVIGITALEVGTRVPEQFFVFRTNETGVFRLSKNALSRISHEAQM
jgi:hypothetical protein